MTASRNVANPRRARQTGAPRPAPQWPWEPAEDALLVQLSDGPKVSTLSILNALAAAGFAPRTPEAINTRRRRLGVNPDQYRKAALAARELEERLAAQSVHLEAPPTITVDLDLFRRWERAVFPESTTQSAASRPDRPPSADT